MTVIFDNDSYYGYATSTLLARTLTEPTTMTIEIPFDDEPYSEIQSTDELGS